MSRIPQRELDDLKRSAHFAGEPEKQGAVPGDAGSPERGEHANLYAGKHPGVAGGSCQ